MLNSLQITNSLSTLNSGSFLTNDVHCLSINNSLINKFFRVKSTSVVSLDTKNSCITLLAIKDNSLVKVEYSLFNRILAIFNRGVLAHAAISQQEINNYIEKNWQILNSHLDNYQQLKNIATITKKTFVFKKSEEGFLKNVQNEIVLLNNCMGLLNKAGFDFHQAKKWFYLQKDKKDCYQPKLYGDLEKKYYYNNSFTQLKSNFYSCLKKVDKKDFFEILTILEDVDKP